LAGNWGAGDFLIIAKAFTVKMAKTILSAERA